MPMKNFKLLVRGSNFRFAVEEDGRTTVKQTGFYVWRAVQAVGPAEAELAVMALLRATEKLRACKNRPDDPPVMFAEDLVELADDAKLEDVNRTGFLLFHGRGAGRPRSMRVAALNLLPEPVRRVANRLWPLPRRQLR